LGDIGDGDLRNLYSLAGDETAPCFVTLVDDLRGVLPVLGLTREREGVLGLSIGNLIDPEPLIGGAYETGEVPFDVFYVIKLGSERVKGVDYDDLPVGLAFVEESHDTDDLDLLDLTDIADLLANLADIEGIVVTLCLGLGMFLGRVFPGLGKGTIVPDVTVVGEAVANEARLFILDILLDVVEVTLLVDFHLGVGPTGDLDNHVEDAAVLIGEEGDVMEWGDDVAILLDVDTMPIGVCRTDGTGGVCGGG